MAKKSFAASAAMLAFVAGMSVTNVGCGGDNGTEPPPPPHYDTTYTFVLQGNGSAVVDGTQINPTVDPTTRVCLVVTGQSNGQSVAAPNAITVNGASVAVDNGVACFSPAGVGNLTITVGKTTVTANVPQTTASMTLSKSTIYPSEAANLDQIIVCSTSRPVARVNKSVDGTMLPIPTLPAGSHTPACTAVDASGATVAQTALSNGLTVVSANLTVHIDYTDNAKNVAGELSVWTVDAAGKPASKIASQTASATDLSINVDGYASQSQLIVMWDPHASDYYPTRKVVQKSEFTTKIVLSSMPHCFGDKGCLWLRAMFDSTSVDRLPYYRGLEAPDTAGPILVAYDSAKSPTKLSATQLAERFALMDSTDQAILGRGKHWVKRASVDEVKQKGGITFWSCQSTEADAIVSDGKGRIIGGSFCSDLDQNENVVPDLQSFFHEWAHVRWFAGHVCIAKSSQVRCAGWVFYPSDPIQFPFDVAAKYALLQARNLMWRNGDKDVINNIASALRDLGLWNSGTW